MKLMGGSEKISATLARAGWRRPARVGGGLVVSAASIDVTVAGDVVADARVDVGVDVDSDVTATVVVGSGVVAVAVAAPTAASVGGSDEPPAQAASTSAPTTQIRLAAQWATAGPTSPGTAPL